MLQPSQQPTKHFPLASRSKNAALKQPKEITSYSRNIEGNYEVGDSSLSYYYLPDADVGLGVVDLCSGIKDFKVFDEARDGEFTGYLKSIEMYERETQKKLAVDIITWRGVMTRLLTLPFDNRNEIHFKIVKFDGQIFIQIDKEFDMQERKLEELTATEEQRKATYGGYKFELMSTLSKPWPECTRKEIERRNKITVNNIEQYGSVVKTGIGRVKYCIAGEVDCCWDYKPSPQEAKDGDDPLSHYVELKTTKVIATQKQAANFEKKLYKTWAQCFLLGIRKIIYGFRDDNMILRSVEEFKTDEIPVLIKTNEPLVQQFNENKEQTKQKNKFMGSLKFFSAVLEFIVDNVSEENTSWRLSYNPRLNKDYLNLAQISDPSVVEQDINTILPEDFRNWRSNELPNVL